MVGINDGVYANLKQENPSLILMRCVCNSIDLAMSYTSAEYFSRNLEYLTVKTHDGIVKSSARQYHYNELYKAFNDVTI